ncbi:vascular endothelial growth factor A-like [Penaeus japonicus]|uniref:vascular endothelial growth factor A-like n=1 Tax=Penaeus japonicus TaxID=27405 RepID=UPI001C715D18|nr:vascular endothelial growth factor A-like [Penaeus japonicus]
MWAKVLLPFLVVFLARESWLTEARRCLTIKQKRAIENTYLNFKCMQPGIKLVELDVPEEYIVFTPSVAAVSRCSMMYCITNGMQCLSVEKRNTTIRVEALSRLQEIKCLEIPVEEDLSCGCQKCQPEICPNNDMVFNSNTCKCECTNRFLSQCNEKVNKGTHTFDRKTCRCMCKETKDCGQRMWNDNTCRCMD